MDLEERYSKVLAWFNTAMPTAETELHFGSPFQLLVAVILSAQCTDKRVNMITPALFEAFPTPEAMSGATFEEVFGLIKSCSYPNSKTRYLIEMSKHLTERYDGKVPGEIKELMTLPGVGRKTANVVISVAYGIGAMPVDTHVFRVSERIGLTWHSKNPLQTEQTLLRHVPYKLLNKTHHWLILHGRYVCKARRPLCEKCGLTEMCRYYQKQNKTSH